jgi:hypothetical protein
MYGLDRQRPGGPPSAFSRVTGIFVALAAGTFLLAKGGPEIGPAVSAAQGDGIHGFFVARSQNCSSWPDACTWSGDFRLTNGTITRTTVEFVGSDPGIRAGSAVRAIDTGNPSSVYLVNGSGQWLGPAGELTLGGFLLVTGTLRVLSAVRRRRRPTPYETAGQAPG